MYNDKNINGMGIMLNGTKFILPISIIKRSFKSNESELTSVPSGDKMISLTEGIFLFTNLCDLLGIEASGRKLDEQITILLERKGARFCLVVDELLGEINTTIKEMPVFCSNSKYISGCAILNDTDVCLILDEENLFEVIEPDVNWTEPIQDESFNETSVSSKKTP